MPEPYYQAGGVTLYHGDCREILPGLPRSALVQSDPPYGINYRGSAAGKSSIHTKRHRRTERVTGDDAPFDPSPLLAFEHVSLFGAQHFSSRLPAGGSFHVWDKRGDYKPCHFADFDLIWINRRTPGRKLRCVWRGLCREVENRRKILHPTQKPEMVVRWAIEMFPATQLVIDPYAGSGTALVVARDMGLAAIGIELEERYCEVAARRLEEGLRRAG